VLLDAGGPMLVVFYGGAIVAGVLGAVALVFLGLWLSRRAKRNTAAQDPEVHS
jgi:hypothetical protein